MTQPAKFVQIASGPSVHSEHVGPGLYALDADGTVWEFVPSPTIGCGMWRLLPMERRS